MNKELYSFKDNGRNFIVVCENEHIVKIDEVDFKVMDVITDSVKAKALNWLYR